MAAKTTSGQHNASASYKVAPLGLLRHVASFLEGADQIRPTYATLMHFHCFRLSSIVAAGPSRGGGISIPGPRRRITVLHIDDVQ